MKKILVCLIPLIVLLMTKMTWANLHTLESTSVPLNNANGLPSTSPKPLNDANVLPSPTAEPSNDANRLPSPTTELMNDANPHPSPTANPSNDANGLPSSTTEPSNDANGHPSPIANPSDDANGHPSPSAEPLNDANGLPSATVKPLNDVNGLPSSTAEPMNDANRHPSPTAKPLNDGNGLPNPAAKPLNDVNGLPSSTAEPMNDANRHPSPTAKPLNDTNGLPNPAAKPLNDANGLPSSTADPTLKITVTDIRPDGARIQWQQQSDLSQYSDKYITSSISYKSEYSNGEWSDAINITERVEKVPSELKLHVLEHAYALYVLRIRTKDQDTEDKPENWSAYQYIEFNTTARIPDNPPVTYKGGFILYGNPVKKISIYWKGLEKSKFSGPNGCYKVYQKIGDSKIFINKTTSLQMDFIPDEIDGELKFMKFLIYASNDIGDSYKGSVIRVPKRRSQYPQNVHLDIETTNGTHSNYTVSWSEPDDKDIIGYTITWYQYRTIGLRTPNGGLTFDYEFNFQRFDKSVRNWDKILCDHRRFTYIAIASDTSSTSSGLKPIFNVQPFE